VSTVAPLGTETDPLRVAIVGSGPSAFYAASDLLNSKARPELVATVDMIDRLPTPWGLVRGGVAPDHPNIKAVSRVFEKTAARPGFRFFGNVELGRDIEHDELRQRYHAVIYAVGAETDRRMDIPGEDLAGSHAANEFVAWYNGHPDYREHEFDLSVRRAVVIGAGNVALDVVRMLALSTDELAGTDTADHALEALAESKIEEIVLIARRGPAQAAFTNPELRELGELAEADVIVAPGDVEIDEHSAQAIARQGELTDRRNVEILTDYSQRKPAGKRRRVELRFLLSPVAILGSERVEGVEVVRNHLARDADGTLRARPTEHHETLEAGIVFRSIGYRGRPLAGVPFDERSGTIPNDAGRIVDPHTQHHLAGEYAVGWIKRGPTGVIGTNKRDAQETVELLLDDLAEERMPTPASTTPESILELLAERGVEYVDYAGWEAIDAHEKAAGEPQGRPRVKLATWDELLAASKPA
jgi:ferredoxin/flavodoxin---NADP+ reductase